MTKSLRIDRCEACGTREPAGGREIFFDDRNKRGRYLCRKCRDRFREYMVAYFHKLESYEQAYRRGF